MQAATEAAAAAGRKPARTKIGISVGPTAADSPPMVGMAAAKALVTTILAGSKRMPSLRRGFVKSVTRCLSQPVSEITAAKPIAEQMAIMRLEFVIDLSNCLKAVNGSSDRIAIKKPALKRTRRVSYRLIKA